MSDWRGWTLHANQPQGEPVSEPSRLFVGGSLDLTSERRWVLWDMPRGEVRSVEVMPISEHEEFVREMEHEDAVTAEEWKSMRDQIEVARELRKAARALVDEIQATWVWTPEVSRRFEHLRSVLSPVNPQEDER